MKRNLYLFSTILTVLGLMLISCGEPELPKAPPMDAPMALAKPILPEPEFEEEPEPEPEPVRTTPVRRTPPPQQSTGPKPCPPAIKDEINTRRSRIRTAEAELNQLDKSSGEYQARLQYLQDDKRELNNFIRRKKSEGFDCN